MKFKNEKELVMFLNGMLVEILFLTETAKIPHQAPSLSNEVATQR